MTNDPRCCGTDTCLINADGECWCGQKWDGEKMCFPVLNTDTDDSAPPSNAAPEAND
ncbi:hypothetical protein [Actimicrobium antarcticum]|uniref:EGF-like domain-containing protein n=1 Tax=Actimicrobium antarcticum TaxID=1051899 RepID=A0ABP7TN57_9BURK